MDSKRERAGDSWERGSVVVSLHTHCAHMFMLFSCGQMGGGGTAKGQACMQFL